ncbi:unnamed protein product [Parnassius apollo]|uniref:(apollo) hypothetical protein n=1 Tax=Parnassius apollo TaxID=110799 RepID=A0A8S3XRK7_PARAO|nr:unnamed protein product [Parnassius apollo]
MVGYPCNILFFLFLHFSTRQCELMSIDVKGILQQCNSNINTSLELDRNDKMLIANWTAEFQVKQVNITSHYRLEMTRHREHSFRKVNFNTKWKQCLRLHNKEIKISKISYYDRERECLKKANSGDKERKTTVSQVEKEIKKWRKSYKYLSNLCEVNNPDDKENAEFCLADYIKRDNYDSTFERLIILKLEAMSDLLQQMNMCLSDLEDCLRVSLSEHLENIRTVMETLNHCYTRNEK